jgi:twitching motility two-component system response regulator PilH
VIKPIKKNILVVDCSLTSLVLLEGLLTEYGYSVKTASSLSIAKKIIKRWEPSLILLDILPDTTNRIEFTQQLSQNQNDIPVIIVSSIDHKSLIAMTKAFRASDYISKPVEQETLIRKVNDILKLLRFENK